MECVNILLLLGTCVNINRECVKILLFIAECVKSAGGVKSILKVLNRTSLGVFTPLTHFTHFTHFTHSFLFSLLFLILF